MAEEIVWEHGSEGISSSKPLLPRIASMFAYLDGSLILDITHSFDIGMARCRHGCMRVVREFTVPSAFLFDWSPLIVCSGPGRVFRYAYSNNAEHSIKRNILEACWPAINMGGRASLL